MIFFSATNSVIIFSEAHWANFTRFKGTPIYILRTDNINTKKLIFFSTRDVEKALEGLKNSDTKLNIKDREDNANPNVREYKYRDHSLFAGYGPVEEPKYAVAVVAEHSGPGSRVAAPIASSMFDFLFKKRISNAWNSKSIQNFPINWKISEIRQKSNLYDFSLRINKYFVFVFNR